MRRFASWRRRAGVVTVSIKRRQIGAVYDVPQIFSDDNVRQLVADAKLPFPPHADLPRFAAGIRGAAEIYISDLGAGDDNAVHHEINGLYSAAHRRSYLDAAKRIESLSKQARDFIAKRSARPSVPWKLPSSDALGRPETRDDACATIVSLLRIGGRWQEGRRRPGGKRSMTFVATLHAPTLQRNPPKRQAEYNFVMLLQVAYAEATGDAPALTVNPVEGKRGPFARLANACLKLIGAASANVDELINELNRRARAKGRVNPRRKVSKRQLP
jgi:hypothetical protein